MPAPGSDGLTVAAIENVGDRLSGFAELLEITHHSAYRTHHGEGVRVSLNDGGKGGGLSGVDHAHHNPGILAGVSALRLDAGGAVMEQVNDVAAQLIGVVGDNLIANGTVAEAKV